MDIRLTLDEMRFFKRNGFVIKRKALKQDSLKKAHEVFWDNAPSQLQRHEPSSWIGPFRDEFNWDDGTDKINGFRWNLRTVGNDEWMMDLISRNVNLIGMAEQLLGKGNLLPPSGTRGIYTTLPRSDDEELEDHLHVDQHIFHLGTVAYLDRVAAGGGGFRVWPTSHLWFCDTFESQFKGKSPNRYTEAKSFIESQPSLECTGDAGDVVFWHHRLAHMAGHNISSKMRMAILYDFKKVGFDYSLEEPPLPNVWRDWPGLDTLD